MVTVTTVERMNAQVVGEDADDVFEMAILGRFGALPEEAAYPVAPPPVDLDEDLDEALALRALAL